MSRKGSLPLSRQSPVDLSKGEWRYLCAELVARTKLPWNSVPFVFYVVIGIFVFGALGIWIELYQFLTAATPDAARIIIAMITFFSTLIGTSAVQLAYDASDQNNKIMLAFALLVLVVFSAFAILLSKAGTANIIFGLNLLCSLFAIWVWWIANARAQVFAFRTDAPIGGDPARVLDGNLEGYQV